MSDSSLPGSGRLSEWKSRRQWLQEAQAKAGYRFDSQSHLEEALTHRSYTQAQEEEANYERLEFLGDSVIELVVSEQLFLRFPGLSEGDLTRMRASVVSREHLAGLAERLDLGRLLRLGKGEEKSGGRRKRAILADVFESLAGAIYLDGGLGPARSFLLEQLASDLDRLVSGEASFHDHKSLLQEALHRQGKTSPIYRIVDQVGPPHERVYKVEVQIEGKAAGLAVGRSKKKAEQRAAASALGELVREKSDDQERVPEADPLGEQSAD